MHISSEEMILISMTPWADGCGSDFKLRTWAQNLLELVVIKVNHNQLTFSH